MSLPVVRVELVDHLPGDTPLVPLQRDGELILRAQRQDISERAADAATHAMQYMLDTGSIALKWPPQCDAKDGQVAHPN